MDGWLLFLIIFGIYIAIVATLHKKGILEKYNILPIGPILMIRTIKGREFLNRLATPKRLWKGYGILGVGFCIISMFVLLGFFLVSTYSVTDIPADAAPTPDMILGLPGINPFIPLWYGILGLVVGVVVHEFAHGILMRAHGLKIKSMGVLLAILPIGAFVEQDEEELQAAPKKARMRVFAAGPTTNMVFAILAALIFSWVFMGSLVQVNDGPIIISGVVKDSPLDRAGVNELWMQVESINGTQILPVDIKGNFSGLSVPPANNTIPIMVYYEGNMRSVEVVSGVVISWVHSDSAADSAGLEVGMLFANINGSEIRVPADFYDAMDATYPGQNVSIVAYEFNENLGVYVSFETNATLLDRYEFLLEKGYSNIPDDYRGKAYFGVSASLLGLPTMALDSRLMDRLEHPILEGEGNSEAIIQNVGLLALLPVQGLRTPGLTPMESPFTDLYEPTGALAGMPNDVFWILANSFYWLFWINLMVGLTNILPAVPLDGGFIFRDFMDSVVSRVKPALTQERREEVVRKTSLFLAFLVLFMIIWPMIGPRL